MIEAVFQVDQADHRSKLQPLLEFKDGRPTNIENYMLRLPELFS